jgi:outer membrane protein OmpA-like peptidoglycan-associated protein
VAASCLAFAAGDASAQDARTGDLAAERFQPAPGPGNLITVETARVPATFAYSFGLVVDYARDPLRLRHCLPGPCASPGATVDHLNVVSDLGTANVLAAITPFPRFQVGLRLPFQYIAGQGVVTDSQSPGFGAAQPGGIKGFAMGDPMLEAKVRAIGDVGDRLAAGLAFSVSAPVGHATANGLYAGDGSPVVGVRAIVDLDVGRFFAAVNAGAGFKSTAHLGTLDLGSELRFGGGAGVRLTPELHLLAEGTGTTNFTTAPGSNTAELDGAFRWAPTKLPVQLTLGGGAGLNQGAGTPLFRMFLGAGIYLDRKAGAGEGGDPDLDKDGILNEEDQCPREGGDVVRIKGPFYGCPKRDSDEDGVLDHVDACPDKPGVRTQDPATNGCPPNDRDHDGIPNDVDKCPDAPETYNGFEDADGCPDAPPIRAEVRADQIVIINERVQFGFNSDRIEGARSFEALDLVARAMHEHPEIKRVEVAGHTDDRGPRAVNVEVSRRRAAKVLAYLVGRGIAEGRLTSNGVGPDLPVAPNNTEEGRSANRRVQFNILYSEK